MYLFSFGRKKYTTANHNIQNSDFKIQSFLRRLPVAFVFKTNKYIARRFIYKRSEISLTTLSVIPDAKNNLK